MRKMRKVFKLYRAIFIVALVFTLSVAAQAKIESSDNSAQLPDISGLIWINVYEEYGKNGFVEYSIRLPDGVIKENIRGEKGTYVEHPVRLNMLSSDNFAMIYKPKILHDESTHEDPSTFSNDQYFYDYAWGKNGQKIAYSSSKNQFDAHSILVVKDVAKHEILFRQDLNKKSIVDIAWDSNNKCIAVLSAIFTHSKNPFARLISLGGHPVGHRVYYLDIYDIYGNHLYESKENDIGEFSAGRGSGLGAVVWVDEGP